MDKKTELYIKLLLTPRIGNVRFIKIVKEFGDIENIFDIDRAKLKQVLNISDDEISAIFSAKKDVEERFPKELEEIHRYNIKIIRIDEDEYPEILKTIYSPPPLLYISGSIKEKDLISLGIVGTRHASTYGMGVAQTLAQELVENGLTIISGLASGIDTAAHKGALKAGGRTIAVVGTGLSLTYPRSNEKLRREIEENGAVVSEFPMTMPPDRFNFPLRNRIISGLSLGTCVIEAGEKSGALITARYALEQGREVFAVPSNITSPHSFGVNKLIQDGAKLVMSVGDILEEISMPMLWQTDKKPLGVAKLQQIEITDEEKKIYDLINLEEKVHIETIALELGMSLPEIMVILTNMELKGILKQLAGKFYCKAL